MKSLVVLAISVLALAACTAKDNGVRVTDVKPAPPKPVAPVSGGRTEPIFYNGKTYTLKFSPSGGGSYAMAVRGMSAGQQKDAVAVATSSLRYFSCPDGKTGKVIGKPNYQGGEWVLSARCG
jgi:hypothetical protein